MKKLFLIIVIAFCSSAVKADLIPLSCTKVQGVPQECFKDDPNGWEEYLAALEASYCGGTDTEEDDDPNPSVSPGQQ